MAGEVMALQGLLPGVIGYVRPIGQLSRNDPS